MSVKNYFYRNAKLFQNIPDYSEKCQLTPVAWTLLLNAVIFPTLELSSGFTFELSPQRGENTRNFCYIGKKGSVMKS